MKKIELLHAYVHSGKSLLLLDIENEELLKLVRSASNGPFAVVLYMWLASQAECLLAEDAMAELVGATQDPSVLAEVVEILSKQALSKKMKKKLWEIFINRIDDKELYYGVRAQCLHGALILAQHQKSLLLHLKGFLTDIDIDDDEYYLRHVAKILGVMLGHSPEPEFREKLHELLNISLARDEAAMELGLDSLRQGLDATSQEVASNAFKLSYQWFGIALESSEERVDADLYFNCLDILISVYEEGFSEQSAAKIDGLINAAWRYSACLGAENIDDPSWLGLHTSERVHWTMLASKLGLLGTRLTKRIWINAIKEIEEELIAIYQASRTILHIDQDTGLDLLIRPQIATSLLTHRRHLDELDQWIKENEASSLLPDAVAMRSMVEEAREASVMHRPFLEGSDSDTLQQICDAGKVTDETKESIAGLLQLSISNLSVNENPKTDQLISSILDKMKANEDYCNHQAARSLFNVVLIMSTFFISHKHEVGLVSDSGSNYLFIRPPNKIPLEQDLQSDYFRFLKGSCLNNHVYAEVSDIGSGRADVYFKASGVSTVTEVKRSSSEMTHEQLLQNYGFQTIAYQTTNVTFGFLLVLDLFDRHGLQPHFQEQVSLQSFTPNGQKTSYDIVVMRVQGLRKKPSALGSSR